MTDGAPSSGLGAAVGPGGVLRSGGVLGPGRHLVVMGVSGSGKSTVGELVADSLGLPFAEGDLFHPPANVAAMAAGVPLTDADRLPWLRTLAEWMGEHAGTGSVVACSSLRRSYRDVLRSAGGVTFAHLALDAAVLRARMEARTAAGGHFMPASLLASQLATLEPLGPEEGVTFDGDRPLAVVLADLEEWIRSAPAS